MITAPALASPQLLGARIAYQPSRLPSRAPLRLSPRAPAAAYASAPARASEAATAPSSLYDVLGLSPRATVPEVKSAYRRLARACHPDVAAGGGKDAGPASADEFMRVHAAYATLSDPDKRADYDRELAASRWRRAAGQTARFSRSFSGSSRRTWETDQCW